MPPRTPPPRHPAGAPPRTSVAGPAFVRLLVRLTDADVTPDGKTLAERLGQWIDWSRAVALSRALDGRVPPPADAAPALDRSAVDACAHTRAALVSAISDLPAAAQTHPVDVNADTAAPDYVIFRNRYLDLQRTMQAATGRLRGHLRDRLTRESAGLARLAEVDAVMEQTLSPREQALLAAVPALLGKYFERLRDTAQVAPADPETADDNRVPQAGAWLDRFRSDMQAILLAELELRFHPIEGLLAALPTR